MITLTRSQIEQTVYIPEVIEAIKQGFIAYSAGQTIMPPVASLHFDQPPGDCHIKYGYAKEGNYYVVKIASGFPQNPQIGLPSGNGLMLLFDKKTGDVVALLQDEGYLTDLRTAVAGCIAARYLAPRNVSCVGILGTGAQAFHQLKLLSFGTTCRSALIWGRDAVKAERFKHDPILMDWQIEIAPSLDHLTAHCNLIVTTTSSTSPLLFAHQIQPGTHITAVGADDVGKQELDPAIFEKTDRVVVDSRSQCLQFGDTSYAIERGSIEKKDLIELGEVIANHSLGRTAENQITVADLTGIAIQDLQIATSVLERHLILRR